MRTPRGASRAQRQRQGRASRRKGRRLGGGAGPGNFQTTSPPGGTVEGAPGDILQRTARRAGLGCEDLIEQIAAVAGQHTGPAADGGASAPPHKRSDVVRLLLACERLGLDPLAGEAYLARSLGNPAAPPQVVLGLGGWLRLLGEHPAVCGVEFAEGPPSPGGLGLPAWASCTIHRRDRSVPTTVREYMDECRGATGAWLTHPRRMLRHCALVQCARVAIGAASGAATALPGEWAWATDVAGHGAPREHATAGTGPGRGTAPCDAQALRVMLTQRDRHAQGPSA